MECFLTFLAICLIVAVANGVNLGMSHRGSRLTRAMRAIHAEFGGRLIGGGWIRPSARFPHGATQVVVDSPKHRGRRLLRVHVQLPPTDFRFQLGCRPSRRSEVDPAWDSLVADTPELARRFHAWANDTRELARVLSPGVKAELTRLAHFTAGRDLSIVVERSALEVSVRLGKMEPSEAARLTRLALDLHDQWLLTAAAGIEFLQGAPLQPIESALCQICGDPLGRDVVLCRRCKTPHHLDCWRYFGGCSIYGCDEPEFTRPTVATVVEPPSDAAEHSQEPRA